LGSSFRSTVVRGVQKVGDLLALHFPRATADRNELPNVIDEEPEHS
jgi:uncharacterized membrane protein